MVLKIRVKKEVKKPNFEVFCFNYLLSHTFFRSHQIASLYLDIERGYGIKTEVRERLTSLSKQVTPIIRKGIKYGFLEQFNRNKTRRVYKISHTKLREYLNHSSEYSKKC